MARKKKNATEQTANAQTAATHAGAASGPITAAAPKTTPAQTQAAPAATTKPKPPGIAPNAKTRAYFAGLVIKRHGHAAGVTKEMVAEVDAAYAEGRKPNPIESEICLRNAWHVVRAWTETQQ